MTANKTTLNTSYFE